MQKITTKKIEELLVKTGHSLVVADLDLIMELDKVADRVAGITKDEARLLFEPFELSGLLFYPMSVAKSLWFAEKCEEWGIEGTSQESLLFWLLTIPNETGLLDRYAKRSKANRAVKRLARRLHCSPEEMTRVYDKCVGIDLGENINSKPEYGGLIECLLREYGGKPDRWLYDTPLPMIETLMTNFAARINAEQESARKSASKGGQAVAPVASERLKALRSFRIKANEIQDLWSLDDG